LKAKRGVEKRNGDTVSVCLRVYLSDCLAGGFNKNLVWIIYTEFGSRLLRYFKLLDI